MRRYAHQLLYSLECAAANPGERSASQLRRLAEEG